MKGKSVNFRELKSQKKSIRDIVFSSGGKLRPRRQIIQDALARVKKKK